MSPKGNRTEGGTDTVTTPPVTPTTPPKTPPAAGKTSTQMQQEAQAATKTSGKTTSQLLIEAEQEYSNYLDELKQYKSMTPEQQAQYYPTIANHYQRADIISRTLNDPKFKFTSPAYDYDYAAMYQKDEPKPGPKDWRPPDIEGGTPLVDFFSAAAKVARNSKLDFLASAADFLKTNVSTVMSSATQALTVDVMRDLVGFYSEAQDTWQSPEGGKFESIGVDLGVVGKSMKILTNVYGNLVFTRVPEYGVAGVALFEMEGRVASSKLSPGHEWIPATAAEKNANPRERYEMAKGMGGTLEYFSGGIVDLARGIFKAYGEAKVEQAQRIGEGKLTLDWFGKAYAAAQSEEAYSKIMKPAIEAEFIRKYRDDGTSPDLLAMSLNDPVKELVGQVMFDLLNFVEFAIVPIKAAVKFRDAQRANDIRVALQDAGKLDDLKNLENASQVLLDAAKTGSKSTPEINSAADVIIKLRKPLEELTTAEQTAAKLGRARFRVPFTGMFGKPAKYYEVGGAAGRFLAKVSSTHVSEAVAGLKPFIDDMMRDRRFANAANEAEAGKFISETIMHLGRTGVGEAGDINALRRSVAFLGTSAESWSKFFSQNGSRTAHIFSGLLFDADGYLDASKLSNITNMVMGAKGKENALELIVKNMSPLIRDIFPTVGRRIEFEARAANMLQDISGGPSKRVLQMQDDIAKVEKKTGGLLKSLQGKMSDDEFAKKVAEWVKNPDKAPGKWKTLQKDADYIGDARREIQQASELPRNLKYWSDRPVTDLERLGWNVLEGKEALYSKFMPLLNRVYIRWNTGQWGRNFLTNELHFMVDYGSGGLQMPADAIGEMRIYEGQGLVPTGIWAGTNALTGEKVAGQGLELYKDIPYSQRVERFHTNLVVNQEVKNIKHKVFGKQWREVVMPQLDAAGVPKDLQRSFITKAEAEFSYKKAADAMSSHPVTYSYFLPDKKELETIEGFGLQHDLDRLVQPNMANNKAAWEDFATKIKNKIKDGEGVLHSKAVDHLNDTSGIAEAWAKAGDNVFEQPHPLMMAEVNHYRAAKTQFNKVFDELEWSGAAKLAGSGEQSINEFHEICKVGNDALDASYASVRGELDKLNEGYFKLKNRSSSDWNDVLRKRTEFTRVADDVQFNIRMESLSRMRNYLASKGVNIIEWEGKLRKGLDKAFDYFGDYVSFRGWTTEDFFANGHRINVIGEGGSPVLNAFASRGIPLATKEGVSYSWASIQGQLRKQGINWDLPKLAGKNFSPDEIEQLEKAIDAIAVDKSLFTKPGFGITEAWVPSMEWAEIPERILKNDDLMKRLDGFVETKVEGGKTLVRFSDMAAPAIQKSLGNEMIIRQTGGDKLKRIDELYAIENVPVTDEVAEKVRKIEQAKRQKEIRALESGILREYSEDFVTIKPQDTADFVGTHQGLAQQREDVMRIVSRVLDDASANAMAIRGDISPDHMKAFYSIADKLDPQLSGLRPAIQQVVRGAVDFTMLNYENRRGFDVLLGFLMPYHYWYSRTYYNWMQRMALNPGTVAAYAVYRKTLERVHSELPEYYKYNLNSNELFGLNSDNPMFINLEATFNPLNGITGVDFNDPDKSAGWLANLVQQIGKFGPSIHTPILLTIGALYGTLGRNKDFEIGKDSKGNPILRTGEEVAGSWLGRLIPQTATIKAMSNLLNFDPFQQGVGGLEIDPMVNVLGGQGKYEIRGVQRVISQFEAAGKLPDGTPFTHEQSIEAQYAGKGPIWEMASMEYGRQRAPGALLSAIGGPGFKARPKTDMEIDKFYEDMNELFMEKGLMDGDTWRKRMDELYTKHPYMSGLLMARKSSIARDEALAYDILKRIPPGGTSDYAKMVDLDPELIDRFYSMKGLTDDKGKPTMTEIEMGRFMFALRDLGSLIAMPPTATRNEWNAARQRYSQTFSRFSDETMRLVDTYYDIKKKDIQEGRDFLKENPEIQEFLTFKEQAVMADPLLMRYYGGIGFMEQYFESETVSEAEVQWPGIEKIAWAYSQVRKINGDTEAFLKEHPELKAYWDFLDRRREETDKALELLAAHIPEEPSATWRADAREVSAKAKLAYENRMADKSTTAKELDAMVLPYVKNDEPGPISYEDFDFNTFLKREMDKRYPGLAKNVYEYKALKTKAEQTEYLRNNPAVAEYVEYEKSLRRKYNSAKRVAENAPEMQPASWGTWKPLFAPAVQRLVEAYFSGGNVSSSLRRSLERALLPYGITDVDDWLDQMKASLGAEVLQ